MSTEDVPATDNLLDISQEVCPMSFILTKQAITCINTGESLEVVCGSGDPVRNISIQLKEEGHTISNVKREGDSFRLTVTKG